MTVTITLPPEIEERFREEAQRHGVTVEQFASQRLLEAELLWRISAASPESETRQLHRLLRRRNSGRLTEAESELLQALLDEREERGAQRTRDLATLAQLRTLPVRQLMERLGYVRSSLSNALKRKGFLQ